MKTLEKVQNLVFPLPVTLVTCRAKEGDKRTDNIIPLSWVGIIEHRPHMVNIVIGKGKYSAGVIGERKEFGLCVATEDILEKVDMCGYTHGDRVDKFDLVKLTKFPAEKTDLSLISECPVCLECEVKELVRGKTHDVFFAEVVCTHVDERFIKDNGEIDLKGMNILSYVDGNYWTMGRQLAKLYFSRRD